MATDHGITVVDYIEDNLDKENREILNGLRRSGLIPLVDEPAETIEWVAEQSTALADVLKTVREGWDEEPLNGLSRERYTPERAFLMVVFIQAIADVREHPGKLRALIEAQIEAEHEAPK